MEDRFVAEPMLGKLAKWLRVMGYDAIYKCSYREEDLSRFMAEGRRLLSRRLKARAGIPGLILIRSEHVGEQLKELGNLGYLKLDRSRFFTRCLVCNVTLKEADPEVARASLPDYVFHENPSGILCCPGCGRFFWSGTHRGKMLSQLEEWGLWEG
jgi:uncharacterized protein with PIN domain